MKSDPGLMILKYCGATYQWRVYAARLKESDVFEVRSLVRQHTCSIIERGGYQTQATASVIWELMKTKFAGLGGGPKPGEIRRMMRGDHNVSISYWKSWRSRDLAVDNGQGNCIDSYSKLHAYLNNLVAANPGTLAAFHTESTEQGGGRFKYIS